MPDVWGAGEAPREAWEVGPSHRSLSSANVDNSSRQSLTALLCDVVRCYSETLLKLNHMLALPLDLRCSELSSSSRAQAQ